MEKVINLETCPNNNQGNDQENGDPSNKFVSDLGDPLKSDNSQLKDPEEDENEFLFNVDEEQARKEFYCRGCRGKKDALDIVVCWECFKYRDNCLKYFEGTFQEWLKSVWKK